ncbi:hypothetical protein CSW17_09420, partial [Thermus scotoductus]
GIAPLVVDPVMVAKGGDPLLAPEAVQALKERLFPLATLIRPTSRPLPASGSTGQAPSPWSRPRTPWGSKGSTFFPRSWSTPRSRAWPRTSPSMRPRPGPWGTRRSWRPWPRG